MSLGKKVQVKTMRFRGVLLLALASLSLTGCAGFDDYYAHDGFFDDVHGGWAMNGNGYPSAPSCGCGSARSAAPSFAGPTFAGQTVSTVSGGSPTPQTREPELLR